MTTVSLSTAGAPMKPDAQETRSACIVRHVQAYLRGTATTMETYADNVRLAYHDRTAATHRTTRFHEAGDAFADLKANGQIVNRILSGTVKMPVDLEEALILALPEEDARACWVDLGGRVGRVSVAQPACGPGGKASDLARCSQAFGQAVQSWGRLLDDLKIDANDDRDDLQEARVRLRNLVAAASTGIEDISAALLAQDAARRERRA